MVLSLSFLQDMKLGHYMKLPPRSTFAGRQLFSKMFNFELLTSRYPLSVQVVALCMTSFVQVGMKEYLVQAVPDLCDLRQESLLTCPSVRVYYSASIVW